MFARQKCASNQEENKVQASICSASLKKLSTVVMDARAVWTYSGKLWRNDVGPLETQWSVCLGEQDGIMQAVQKGRPARPQRV